MISKHENIKFTLAAEDQKRFSFLDVKISRKKKQFATSNFSQSLICLSFHKLRHFHFW